jgi:PAS domain S-box-containing protein
MTTAETSDVLAALRAREELNQRIVEAMPCGLVHVSASGAILSANAEAQRILGQTYDALTQRLTSDFDPETIWEDGTPCRVADYPVTKALTTGHAQPPATIGVLRPDGTVSWAVYTAVPVLEPSTGRVSGAVVTLSDITGRKRIEQALRESEAHLRSVLESAPNMILSADREGRIRFINRAVPPTTTEGVIGTSIYDYVRPPDEARVRACVERVLATGHVDGYDIQGPEHLGARSYTVRVGPISYGSVVAGVTIVTWDVTERRALEAQLAAADRAASIGTLVAGVAHEINNPLMQALGNIELLRRGLRSFPEAVALREAVEAVAEGAGHIRDVVRDLSCCSENGERGSLAVDVHELIESSLRLAQGQLRTRARVRRCFGAVPELSLNLNSARLGQVLLNLILNAAQAIPEGRVDENEVSVTTRVEEGGMLVVVVADTGEGIPPDLINRVFEPFVTTKAAGAGTGLGLHICRSIVTAMGGSISVKSTVGAGTTFSIRLPLVARAIEAKDSAGAGDPSSFRRVLRT